MSVTIKSAKEIELMREAGRLLEDCSQRAGGGDSAGHLHLGT